MSKSAQEGRGPRAALGATLGIAGSLGIHVAGLLFGSLYLTTPDLGLELTLPIDVEFGLVEGMETGGSVAQTIEAPPPEAPTQAPHATEPDVQEATELSDAADAGTPDPEPPVEEMPSPTDAGRTDAGTPADASATVDASLDAGADGGAADSGSRGELLSDGTGQNQLPPGAQLALRMDMERIRASPLSRDVRELLAVIPDWHALLAGSGIEPIDDLDRLLVASPDLRPSRMVLAGRHSRDEGFVRAVVQRMHENHGHAGSPQEELWSTAHGLPVARWPSADETERSIALLGSSHFILCRPEDLPRILGVARARTEGDLEGEGNDQEPDADTFAEALLSMGPDDALTFEVENAPLFARGQTEGVPTRLFLAVREVAGGASEVRARGTYESSDAARSALAFWERARTHYARNVFVTALRMSPPLEMATLQVDGAVLSARTRLNGAQLRFILGYVRGILAQQARGRRPAPAPEMPGGARAPEQQGPTGVRQRPSNSPDELGPPAPTPP